MRTKPVIMFDLIKSIIADPSIKVISFDIFDTLLVRPACFPSDIFYLLEGVAKKITGEAIKGFYLIRLSAESEARNELLKQNPDYGEITLTEIYNFIGSKYGLDEETKNKLREAEIKLESDLIRKRKQIIEIYNEAIASGKKVVLTSDFYFEKENLTKLLSAAGIEGYTNLYVSSEYKKRKDTGELYAEVIKNEKVKASEILHIGDNYNSDVVCALNVGITAVHVPSNYEIFFSEKLMHKEIWKNIKSFSSSERILLGISINKVIDEFISSPNYADTFGTGYLLGYYGLGPFLFSLGHFISHNNIIQQNYGCINFASRDGYLPKIIYDLLRNENPGILQSKYIYGGRQAYNIASYEGDIFKYLTSKTNHLNEYTLENLYDTLVKKNYLSDKYSAEWLRKSFFNEDKKNGFEKLKSILSKYHKEIKELLDKRKNSVAEYYKKEISLNSEGRSIIFDVGYSGSVSEGISPFINGKIDKLYLWQTQKNEISDEKNKTKSIVLCGYQGEDKDNPPVFLAIEELFSPLEKACVGFKRSGENIYPLFEDDIPFSEKMKISLREIQEGAVSFTKEVLNHLGEYNNNLQFTSIHKFLNPLYYSFNNSTDNSIHLLDEIFFNDNFSRNNQVSLSAKIEERNSNYFHRTNFLNKENIVTNKENEVCANKLKIGIHLHLFNLDQAPLFVNYLKETPYKFDLFISIVNEDFKEIVTKYFNSTTLPSSEQIIVKVFQNRGRDVAPWLVGYKKELKSYDLVCHIHTKKSVHFDWGNNWSEYLLDNLISPAAFKEIINYFNAHSDLGVVFPPIYQGIYKFWVKNSYSHLGLYNLLDVCSLLLKKMGIHKPLDRNNVFFSVGNMFWYRNKALKPLFGLNLKYTDFPEEPIPVDGTIAHAIERLHTLVAEHEGYKTINYINQDELINSFHKNILVNVFDLDDNKANLGRTYSDILNIYLAEERFFDAVLLSYRFYRENSINKFIKESTDKIQRLVNEKIKRDNWNSSLRSKILSETLAGINRGDYVEAKSKLNILLNYEPMNYNALQLLVENSLNDNNLQLASEVNRLILSIKPTKESLELQKKINQLINENNRGRKSDIQKSSLPVSSRKRESINILTSIIIPVFNQYKYTKQCLESIKEHTNSYYEIIIIDNASNDETAAEIKKNFPEVILISNTENKGFPSAVNQGLKESIGKYILLLNNDIILTDGWLERMIKVAESNSRIGLVGPISNVVSGVQLDKEAKYDSIKDMHSYAAGIKKKNQGKSFEFPRVAFLCTLIKKEVIEKIGGLDERFSPGNFEDDDFCLRAQIAGYKTIVALDVFIHHFGSKSFTAEGTKKYAERLEINKKIFIEKWGADPEDIWLHGKKYLTKNINYPLEIDEFSEAVKRAHICIKDNEFSLALRYLEFVFENNFPLEKEDNQKMNSLFHLAGKICLQEGKYEMAINYFNKEIDNSGGASRTYLGLGDAFTALGKDEEAAKMYSKCDKQPDIKEYSNIK